MKIIYRSRALRDLESVSAYIAKDSPAAAAKVVTRIVQSLNRLARFPYSGRPGVKPETRELSVTGLPYIVVHRVLDETAEVEIIAVYHTARNRRPDDY